MSFLKHVLLITILSLYGFQDLFSQKISFVEIKCISSENDIFTLFYEFTGYNAKPPFNERMYWDTKINKSDSFKIYKFYLQKNDKEQRKIRLDLGRVPNSKIGINYIKISFEDNSSIYYKGSEILTNFSLNDWIRFDSLKNETVWLTTLKKKYTDPYLTYLWNLKNIKGIKNPTLIKLDIISEQNTYIKFRYNTDSLNWPSQFRYITLPIKEGANKLNFFIYDELIINGFAVYFKPYSNERMDLIKIIISNLQRVKNLTGNDIKYNIKLKRNINYRTENSKLLITTEASSLEPYLEMSHFNYFYDQWKKVLITLTIILITSILLFFTNKQIFNFYEMESFS